MHPTLEQSTLFPEAITLDDEQRAAVEHADGPLLIVAGAGTGKTTVIARRIAHLIESERARPHEILALAFNEKAAAEMQERVDLLVPYGYADVRIGTFHSFGEEVLSGHGMEIGIAPGFTVLDKTAQALFLAERIETLPLRRYAPLSDPTRYLKELAGYFSRVKDEPYWPEDLRRSAESARFPSDPASYDRAERLAELADAYEAYNRMLWEAGFVDFGDLLALTHKLFETSPATLRRFQERYRYVLVDEFQDTNAVQYKIVRRLVESHRNLAVVGDDDQSIYRFRGAHLQNILDFREHYPDAREIVLRKNYRSTRQILSIARRLITFNSERLETRYGISKSLTSDREGALPQCREFATDGEEARWVAAEIERSVVEGRRRWRDFAILVRTNKHAEPFLRALDERGISYYFSGSRGLFQRSEVKQLIALLQSLFQDTRPEYLYLLASEGYGVPEDDLTRLMHLLREHPGTLRTLFTLAVRGAIEIEISEEGRERIAELLRDLESLQEYARGRRTGEVLYRYLEQRGILRDLLASRSFEDEVRARNLVKFFQIIRAFEKVAVADRVALFLRHLDAVQDYGEDPAVAEIDAASDVVQVLTIHKAKGLEFPAVFLVQAATDRFPTNYQSRSLELPADASSTSLLAPNESHREEERRLCYVALTRAREELIATYARDYGTKNERTRSIFLSEAFDLGKPVPPRVRRRALEALEEQRTLEPGAPRSGVLEATGPLHLSYYRLDDYDTCPLKYHLLHARSVGTILPPDHRVHFGRAVHHAIAFALRRRLAGAPPDADEIIEVFRSTWKRAGHLSEEHERKRFDQASAALRAFHAREVAAGDAPSSIEQSFRVSMGGVVLEGRIDRVDEGPGGLVLVDYKTSEQEEGEKAEDKANADLQLSVYALAYREMTGRAPDRVELRYVMTGTTGSAEITESRLRKTREKIADIEASIRAGAFEARPSEFLCRRCLCRSICKESAA